MSDATKPSEKVLGLPRVGIEIVPFTPEQRKNGEPGKVRVIENANSWLNQMPRLLLPFFADSVSAPVRTYQDLNDVTRTLMPERAPKLGVLSSNITGVQVGTGGTAVDRDNRQLGTRIADGNAATQLVYSVVGALTKTAAITGGYRVMIERSFNNDSGADITILETGLRILCRNVGNQQGVAMVLRDIINPGHTVVDGGAVIMRYLLDWLS